MKKLLEKIKIRILIVKLNRTQAKAREASKYTDSIIYVVRVKNGFTFLRRSFVKKLDKKKRGNGSIEFMRRNSIAVYHRGKCVDHKEFEDKIMNRIKF